MKEHYKELFFIYGLNICKYKDVQHKDGTWINICKFEKSESDYPKCKKECCPYLKIFETTLKEKFGKL